MQSVETVYNELIRWLRQEGAYLPSSAELLPLIKATYTPQEARLLTGMPLALTEVGNLAALKGIDQEELERFLEAMARKGLVFSAEKDGQKLFRPGDPRFIYLRSIFWSGRRDRYTETVATGVNKYYRDGFGEHWRNAKHKGLRVLPINQAIPDTRTILPYENIAALLDRHDRIAVAACACRHRKNSAPESPDCSFPLHVCMHFGKFADYIIRTEMGRSVSTEEASEILAECADAGLVHTATNRMHGVDTICNCCRCCCVYFEAFYVLKHSRPMDSSNYHLKVAPEKCTGCGLCEKRCPMDALTRAPSERASNKSGKVAVLKAELCIGCGVCARKCPGGALSLHRRDRIVHPPDIADTVTRK